MQLAGFEYLRDVVFPKFNVGLVHGRMKPAEKEEVMRGFVGGEIQILGLNDSN